MKPFRDFSHSRIINRFEQKKLFFHKILSDSFCFVKPKKLSYWLLLNLFPNFSSITKKKNFCFLTKKTRSHLSTFKLSRISFRELASFGRLNGVFKASW